MPSVMSSAAGMFADAFDIGGKPRGMKFKRACPHLGDIYLSSTFAGAMPAAQSILPRGFGLKYRILFR